MTTVEIQQAVVPKLPIWQTVKAAYRDSFGNLGALLIAAAIPFVLSLLLDVAMPAEASSFGLTLGQTVASILIASLFELAWLRFLLLGPATARPALLTGLGRRLPLFLGYTLILFLFFLPNMLLFQGVGSDSASTLGMIIAAVLLYVLATYLWARFTFALLWIAVDAPQRLGDSWRTTAGNGIRMLVALVLVGIPLMLTVVVLTHLATAVFDNERSQFDAGTFQDWTLWALHGAGNVLLYLYYAFTCSVLTCAFSVCTGWRGDRRALLERFD